MNALINMDPWSFLDDLLGTSNRIFRDMRACATGRFPPVNVYLDSDAVIIDLELPGKTAKDIELTLEPEAVVIADKPEVPADGKVSEKRPAWSRRLDLPFRVDSAKANAKFTNGILRIELPKVEAPGVHHIAIEG